MEFIRRHLAIFREKGLRWQLNVAWKAAAMVGALTLAAHAAGQKTFDKQGLAQLTSKGASGFQEKARR
jgi:hypothetical protein